MSRAAEFTAIAHDLRTVFRAFNTSTRKGHPAGTRGLRGLSADRGEAAGKQLRQPWRDPAGIHVMQQ